MNSSLLPSGMIDLLPPQAGRQRQLVNQLLDAMERDGYAQVNPPLMEYEDSLLDGNAHVMADSTFKVMDPISHKMLALRADMTLQIARIADSVMQHAPRPLCLCYAGQNIRVAPEALQTHRQISQVGLERFGDNSDDAEAHILSTALHALREAGFNNITLDISLPDIVSHCTRKLPEAEKAALLLHINRKDIAAIEQSGHNDIVALLKAAGPWRETLAAAKHIHIDILHEALRAIIPCIEKIEQAFDDVDILIDPIETRGFEYHHHISYALFLRDVGVEIGRGGRYFTRAREEATGLTFYMNTLLEQYNN